MNRSFWFQDKMMHLISADWQTGEYSLWAVWHKIVKDIRVWVMYLLSQTLIKTGASFRLIPLHPSPILCCHLFTHPPVFTPGFAIIHPPSFQLLHALWYNICWNKTVGQDSAGCQSVNRLWEIKEKIPFIICLIPIFTFFVLYFSSAHRLQNTTSLRVWSAVGVPCWCWVKVE